MIVDFQEHDAGHTFRADVCIIGCGAAGITVAREFFKSGISAVVLEGGGDQWELDTQAIYASEVAGLPHKGIHIGRARVFGGTTTLWAGQTLPLDPIDFRFRPWVAESGWPLNRDDLESYYRRAEKTLHLGQIDYDAPRGPFDDLSDITFDASKLRRLSSQFSPKANFAAAYVEDLKTSRNITVVLHANVVKLVANADASAVEGVEIRSLSWKTGWAKARYYIICCGGIETARLLLASDDVEKSGLGNGHDRVGRYFQDHVQVLAAKVQLRNEAFALSLFETFYRRGVAYSPKLALSEKIQEERQTLNATAGVCRDTVPARESSIESAKRLLKGIRQRKFLAPPGPDLYRTLTSPHQVVGAAFRHFALHKAAFQMTGEPWIAIQCECEPNPLSRVMLSAERDALGMRRTRLEWRLTPLVRHTALVMMEAFGQELERLQIGKVDADSCGLAQQGHDWEQLFWDMNHHIGTTRMSTDPSKGVVNSDCRLHSVENLFVSSSAVFPTGGHSNPTFTILSLAVRLADHLKVLLARRTLDVVHRCAL
jgi:choline dehydrogenase-like flavoprotein